MPESALVTLITGAGVAGVFCVLFVTGMVYPRGVVEDLRAERDALRQAVTAERDRADAAVSAAQATRDVFTAIRAGIELTAATHRTADQSGQAGREVLPP